MIRVRQSWLEEFRRLRDTEYGHEHELIGSIRGKPFPARWQMDAGTAWHAAIAGSDFLGDDPDDVFDYGGYGFTADDINTARMHVGPGVWEVPGSLEILPGVLLTCRADHMHGLLLQDNKAKFTPKDAKDYESSMQWRCYLLVFGAVAFRYNLWQFGKTLPKDAVLDLKGLLSFRFWPYEGMDEDVRAMTRGFLDWARSRGLLAALERKVA